jgi:DNA-binding CsgD family transcriptional regulator
MATQHAASLIATTIGYEQRDRLMVTSLLHDVGKLVLARAYPGYPEAVHRDAHNPEACVRRERAELGVDHALVGGVLARRWDLPDSVAWVIEHHHTPDAGREAAIVRLADMLAHYESEDHISQGDLISAAHNLDLEPPALRQLMYELPEPATARDRYPEPCPLSERELDTLNRLASGRVPKEVAYDQGVSASTVRTHIHNISIKLEVPDRAHAVMHATERGWLNMAARTEPPSSEWSDDRTLCPADATGRPMDADADRGPDNWLADERPAW